MADKQPLEWWEEGPELSPERKRFLSFVQGSETAWDDYTNVLKEWEFEFPSFGTPAINGYDIEALDDAAAFGRAYVLAMANFGYSCTCLLGSWEGPREGMLTIKVFKPIGGNARGIVQTLEDVIYEI